jgi:phage/plasmid-associated DNA primase
MVSFNAYHTFWITTPYCKAVEDASKEYIDSQDTVRQFLDEKTEPGDGVKASELFNAYKARAEDNGYKNPLAQNRFGEELKRNGITIKKKEDANYYLNIALKL